MIKKKIYFVGMCHVSWTIRVVHPFVEQVSLSCADEGVHCCGCIVELKIPTVIVGSTVVSWSSTYPSGCSFVVHERWKFLFDF